MTDLTQRYGSPNRVQRRVLIALVAVVAAAGLAMLAWVILDQLRPQVRSGLESFQVIDDHTVTAELTVVRANADTEATCFLRALAPDHQTVGEKTVPVTSGPERQRVDISIRTERRATNVESLGCTAPGQPQRK